MLIIYKYRGVDFGEIYLEDIDWEKSDVRIVIIFSSV